MLKHVSLSLLILTAGCGTSQQAAVPDSTSAPLKPATPQATLVVAQNGQLVKLDGQGRTLQVLTNGFQDDSPAFSPDGANLVFSRAASGRSRAGAARSDLYRMRADGSSQVNLTANLPVSAQDPAWSPDGLQLVFAGDSNLYLVNADGSGLKPITQGTEEDRRPTFSPDGRTIYFQRGTQLFSVPTGGGTPAPLAEGSFPQYAPGEALLFSRAGDLWTLRDGSESQITRSSPPLEFLGQSSRDSIYALGSETPSADPRGDLYLLDADGTNQRRLTTGLQASDLTVSPTSATSTAGVALNVVNNSPYTMYLYVFGYNNGTPSFLNANGTVSAYTSGTIPSIGSVATNTTSTLPIQMPLFTMARIYFSNNPNLTFTAFEESPSLNSSELYDFVEYNYPTQGGTFTADTSCVEAFALPFQITTNPAGTVNGLSVASGMGAGNRTQVFNAISALGPPWSNLIVGGNVRILAPWNGNQATPAFPTNYLTNSIALQWGGNLTLNTYLQNPAQYYVANASTGAWTFAPQNGSGANVTFAQPPTSTQAFNCNFPGTSSDTGLASRLTAILAAGLNRGTLLYPNPSPAPIPFTPVTAGQPDFSPIDFYKPGLTPPQVPQVNQYANILHQQSISGYQYGFASDDQGSQSSTITVPSGIQSFTVTIQSF